MARWAWISRKPQAKIKRYTELGYSNLPICMAKTHLSFSDNPDLKGAHRRTSAHHDPRHAGVGGGGIHLSAGGNNAHDAGPAATGSVCMEVDIDPATGRVEGLF